MAVTKDGTETLGVFKISCRLVFMPRVILTLTILLFSLFSRGQDLVGFRFAQVGYKDLETKIFPADTSAAAYVLQEFGEAHVDYEDPNQLIFSYHIRIKILRQQGVDQADMEIPLFKQNGKEELIRNIYASSFNLQGTNIQETKLDSKSIFTEKNAKYYNVAKFAIPNAKAGSVIEYQYEISSPFLWNFKNWQFQSKIPKVQSEYHTTIPANYVYNITLRGYLKLANHESTIERNCLRGGNGGEADCSVNKYLMKDIPAFKEEEFMTSKENFISAINFELSQIQTWDGRTFKYTKEWKDADLELKNDQKFGLQLRRGKDVVDGYIDVATMGETDQLAKAKKIYDFVKFHYRWNGVYGDQSEFGIKKAFDEKKGNVGDINLTLVAALRYAGFEVDPVLLATRSLSRPIEIHPVLSDFNYVIARLNLDGKIYLLDAVDDFMPFGSIPMLCYNGIGRVMASEGSYWMDIKPTDKDRTVTQIALKLTDDGNMIGTINETYFGYAALAKRREFLEFDDEKAYLDKRKANNHFMNITSYERTASDDFTKPIGEKFGVEFSVFDSPGTPSFLFNPFLVGRYEKNPFKSDTRTYPVDFAVPLEKNVSVMIDFPETFEVASFPEKVGLALPAAGGRYVFGAQVNGNKLMINNILGINRTLFAPEEYPYLKEIYGRMLQAQNTDIVFQRKK
jgi:hypothetical protein